MSQTFFGNGLFFEDDPLGSVEVNFEESWQCISQSSYFYGDDTEFHAEKTIENEKNQSFEKKARVITIAGCSANPHVTSVIFSYSHRLISCCNRLSTLTPTREHLLLALVVF